jgi:hypothetical protein
VKGRFAGRSHVRHLVVNDRSDPGTVPLPFNPPGRDRRGYGNTAPPLYTPQPVSAATLALMRQLDELHLQYPFAGNRMLWDLLRLRGVAVGRKRVATLFSTWWPCWTGPLAGSWYGASRTP